MKKTIQILVLIGFGITVLSGCKEYQAKSIANVHSINHPNAKQEQEIKELSEKIDKLKNDFENRTPSNLNIWSSADINQGYQWAQCGKLPITIQLISATKFLNGYKFLFKIGNPNYVALHNVQLGAAFPNVKNKPVYAESREFVMNPGSWSEVEINAQGIKSSDLTDFLTGISVTHLRIGLN